MLLIAWNAWDLYETFFEVLFKYFVPRMKTFQFHFKSETFITLIIKIYLSTESFPVFFYLRACPFRSIIRVWKHIKHLNLFIYSFYMGEAYISTDDPLYSV